MENQLTHIKDVEPYCYKLSSGITKRVSQALYRCTCGKELVRKISEVKRGVVYSCGCKDAKFKHGMAGTNMHYIWLAMKARCYNPKDKRYDRYGGRGITVCEEWKNDFKQFNEDVGPKPTPKHSIDRIDNDKGYSKENCKWSTNMEQCRNKVNNVMITYKGKTQCIRDWAKEEKIGEQT